MNAPADRWEAVRALMAGAVGPVFPSAQLVVYDADRAVFDEAFGAATRATVYDLASLTKALCTTTLVARHAAAGRLALDDELRPGVTVRLALCHAGGLPAWRPFYQLLDGAADPKRAVIDAARAEPLESAPGARSVYSDLGFILLGDAVERAGGAAIDAQWSALGLSAITHHPDPAACAPTEGELRGVVHDDNARFMGSRGGGGAGHAGLFGTASDVALAARSLVAAWRGEGGGLVAPDWIRALWTPCGVPGSTWCHGWDRPAPEGTSSAGSLFPRSAVGHLGFTGCSLWIDPPRARWVVLLSNRVYPSRANEAIKAFRPTLHDAVIAALDGAHASGAGRPGPAGRAP
jgi:CubicO group peptidase (beta-lactamase class C family)